MIKRLAFVFAFVCSGAFAQICSSPTCTVSATNLTDASNVPLASGKIFFQPVNNVGQPVAAKSPTGQIIPTKIQATVTNGAFSATLVDTGQTIPQNVCYRTWVTDNLNHVITGSSSYNPGAAYQCVQMNNLWCSSTTCNLDTYNPSTAPVATITQACDAGSHFSSLEASGTLKCTADTGTNNSSGLPSTGGTGIVVQTGPTATRVGVAGTDYQAPLGYTAANAANIGVANGIAPLDGASKLPQANLPNIPLGNLPNIPSTQITGLATVASTGAYSDLTGKPSFATVATSGSYADLSNKPTIPSAVTFKVNGTNTGSQSIVNLAAGANTTISDNGSGTITINPVATGSYLDLTNKPTIPSNTNQLTNGAGFITGNQSITLSGDVTGSGATAITATAVKINGTSVPTNSSADQLLGTTASATGSWLSVPLCADTGGQHLNYNTTTHLFSCGTSGGSAASAGFGSLTSGTNSNAAMVISTGASLNPSGSGVITANAITGVASTALSDSSSLVRNGTDINSSNQVTATHLGAALPVLQGGTGQTTLQAAMNSLAGSQGSGKYLRSDGTNTTLSNIQAGDVPTLNQSTTGNAATATTAGNLSGGAIGAIHYQQALDTTAILAANTTTTKKFLTETGNGTTGAAPTWGTIAATDVSGLAPSATTDATNAANITVGTLPAGRLPNPTLSTLGGVQALGSATHQFVNSISTAGVAGTAQPAFSDISGNITPSQMNSGTAASSTTFWRGDGTWAVPSGSGGSSITAYDVNGTSLGTITGIQPGASVSASVSSGKLTLDAGPNVMTVGGDFTVTGNKTFVAQKFDTPDLMGTSLPWEYTAGVGGCTANQLVKLAGAADATAVVSGTHGLVVTMGNTDTGRPAGVCLTTASAGSVVKVAREGQVQVFADTAITAYHIIVPGSTTGGYGKDAGVTSSQSIPANLGIAGIALTSATAGQLFWLDLSRIHGAMPLTLTTTGTSGAATYNTTTQTLNIPQYSGGITANQAVSPLTFVFPNPTGLTLPAYQCEPIKKTGTITAWSLFTGDATSGSATIDVRTIAATTYNSSGPSGATSITSTGTPVLSSAYGATGNVSSWSSSSLSLTTYACAVLTAASGSLDKIELQLTYSAN